VTNLQAISLGIIQGITEFLPISSSAHLAILQHYSKNFQQPGVLFDVMVHFSTLLVVIIYFQKEIIGIVGAILKCGKGEGHRVQRRKALLILMGTIPTGAIGMIFKEDLEKSFSSLSLVGAMLAITGLLLALSDRVKGGKKDLSIFHALLIGTVQGIAIIPGISRSGSTIATGILLGIEREEVARFSFLLSIPAILGAFALELQEFSVLPRNELIPYALGMGFAFVIGLLAIDIFMKIMRRRNLSFFAYYCWILSGIVILA